MLTAKQCMARSVAFEEAKEHIGLHWTDDEVEQKESEYVQNVLERLAQEWHDKAEERFSQLLRGDL